MIQKLKSLSKQKKRSFTFILYNIYHRDTSNDTHRYNLIEPMTGILWFFYSFESGMSKMKKHPSSYLCKRKVSDSKQKT